MNKLRFTEKEVGRMTYRKWSLLYDAYKKEYDREFIMNQRGLVYEDLNRDVTIDDVIPM